MKFWPAALFLLQGLALWAFWSARQTFVSKGELKAELKEVTKELKSGEELAAAALESKIEGFEGALSKELSAVDSALAGLSARVQEQAERIVRVEQAVEHAPTHEDLGRVYTRIGEVTKQLDQLIGEFRATNRNLNLLLNAHTIRHTED